MLKVTLGFINGVDQARVLSGVCVNQHQVAVKKLIFQKGKQTQPVYPAF